ncbi:hypothetical protein J8L98_10930 [Pseudoalteromonas sp. MMG013]|nr:hypothetical protein [Pseudoalteromonas sp. MMG013]MBQ4862200.1 hypothetical protein [Pseudoalteromonas sp. MMG013]
MPFRLNSTTDRVIDVTLLAHLDRLNAPTAGQFALQMVEGVNKVSFITSQ